MVEIQSYGAAQEVTGSKHVLSVNNNNKIMIDCGAFQGKRKEADRKNREWDFPAKNLDAVILSHAHFDHCGLIPLLQKKGFTGNIYSTPATRDLSNLIMLDSAKIQARDAEYLRRKAEKRGEIFDWEPLYDDQDVINVISQFVTLSYNRDFFVTKDIKARFMDAGHILGSSIIYLDVHDEEKQKNYKIGFSGDLGRKNKPIIKDPEYFPPLDYLVLESTYGNRLHEGLDNALKKLEEVINKVYNRSGKVIIPSFAVERTQELIYYIHQLKNENRIPDMDIYVDSPMATNATSIFQVHPECYDRETNEYFTQYHENPFGFNTLHYITNVDESKKLNTLKKPAIIISADGMCEAGRVLHHLKNNVEDPKNLVLIVGYMAVNTLGRRIKEKQKILRIFGSEYSLNAEVEEINAFSGHADSQEILDYLSHIDTGHLKKIFLVHGEPDAQEGLKEKLVKNGFRNIEIIEYGKKYSLE